MPPFHDKVTDYKANQKHRLGADPAWERLNGMERHVKLIPARQPLGQIFIKYHTNSKLKLSRDISNVDQIIN